MNVSYQTMILQILDCTIRMLKWIDQDLLACTIVDICHDHIINIIVKFSTQNKIPLQCKSNVTRIFDKMKGKYIGH